MRVFVTIMTMLMIGAIFAEASAYKGQKAYMKLCKKCHKSGGKLANSHTQSEWEEYFEKNGEIIKSLHQNDKAAMSKLESKRFQKNVKNLRQFFMKFASDSGNVPACN